MTRSRLVTIVRDTLNILLALPVFTALAILSPLLKPRGGVVAPRYSYVGGSWCKTFLADDPALRATGLSGSRPVGHGDTHRGAAADVS